MSWYQPRQDGWLLTLHVQPGAKVTAVVGLHGGALKLRLAAPPVDGKANTALCQFLARCFEVPQSAVELVAGASSRQKRVLVRTQRHPQQVLVIPD